MATDIRRYKINSYYHVYNRGGEKIAAFKEPDDYLRFTASLGYYKNKQRLSYAQALNHKVERLPDRRLQKPPVKRVALVAYCLMPDHFHLLLSPLREGGLTQFIADITNSYTRYFNSKYQGSGSLFRGTFKVVEIDGRPSALNLSRYLHLNPLYAPATAERYRRPEDYPYSSYREWLEPTRGTISDWPEIAPIISLCGGEAAYRAFVEQPKARRHSEGIEDLLLEA